jgi:hypothetical protein
MTLRRLTTLLLACSSLALGLAGQAQAFGGDYVVYGGTPGERAELSAALDASSFDWSLVPARIDIHLAPDTQTYAAPGQIWVNSRLLDTGRFAWGLVQHEYAHQVDCFLLDETMRHKLNSLLHGADWYGVGSPHRLRGDERFASTLAWAYWPSPQSALRPASTSDEAAAMRPARFRALMTKLLGAPQTSGSFAPRHSLSFEAPELRGLALPLPFGF